MYRWLLFVAMTTCIGCARAPEASAPEAPAIDEEPFVPPKPKVYKPIDPSVVKVWAEQGFESGWIGEDTGAFARDAAGLKNPVPGFTLLNASHRAIKDLAALPDPGVPFGIVMEGPSITPEQLRALFGHKSVTTFTLTSQSISAEQSDALMRDLATVPTLTAVHLSASWSRKVQFTFPISTTGLRELSRIKSLSVLSLHRTSFSATDAQELAAFKGLTSLALWGERVTDAVLDEVVKLPSLDTLDLSGSKVTDAGLRRVAAIKGLSHFRLFRAGGISAGGIQELTAARNLTHLELRGTGAKAGELRALAGLKRLRTLDLSGTALKSDEVRELAGLKGLTTLRLFGTDLTDADLKELSSLSGLTSLDVSENGRITGAGLEELRALKGLTDLRVGAAGWFTDRDIKGLVRLQGLERLAIDVTGVTDAGLKELATLKRLTALDLKGFNKLTKPAVAELRAALPNCQITTWGLGG
ncbi:leucine-rich repeat domain protein : Putative regulatory subunit (Fragment) OS=Gemmata sp. Wa1-1 PE=4 SV=1: LRR_6: LRR_6: LRR_6 [Gemmata massiliana]|uniref:Disease resistance R13L4/SHOC-2-like LRR domain-containing protein n=1 Tax=Gemmata massiliana TaxID=1210884 RepID=A0A6P2DH53_9BACT